MQNCIMCETAKHFKAVLAFLFQCFISSVKTAEMKRKSFVSVLFRFHFMRADPITIMIRRRGNRGELFFDEFFLFTSFLTTSLLNSMSV